MPFVAAVAASVVGSITAAVATAATSVGLAIGGVGAGVAFGSLALSVTPALISLGTTLAVSSALSALTAPHVGQTAAGTQVQWQADPSAPVPYVIGRTGTAGSIVFRTVNGEHNKYLHTSTVLSGAGPVKSVTAFTANDQAVPFTADGGEGASGFYLNRMWWKRRLGASDGQAQAWTATNSKDTPANHGATPALIAGGKLSGLAATLWAMEYDAKIYPTGVPKPLQVVEGVTAYDPRLDSTYPGGSGPQRAGDEATWAYSENPAVHAITWCLGRHANGKPTLGLHAPSTAIDLPAFVEAANVADLHGWKVGGVVYSTDGKRDVLRAILEAGSARPIPLGAKISCVVDAPRVSLDTLTGSDVVGEATIATLKPARSAPNTLWPRYREEAQGWEIVPTAAPIAVTAYYAGDGGPRSSEYEWKLVQSADQAATLARYRIENGREFGPITLPCKPRWMGYRPGDCVTIDEPEYGLNGQKCIILTRSVDPATMVVTLTLQSETDGKHPFALGETADPPPLPGVTGKDVFTIAAPPQEDWLALGGTIAGADGGHVPAIVVHGTPEDPYAARLLVDWRLKGSTTWSTARALDLAVDTPLTTTLEGLPEATGFVIGLRYLSIHKAESPRLELGSDDYPIVTGELDIQVEEQITDGVHLAAATGGNALICTDFSDLNKFWGLTFNEAQANPGATIKGSLFGRATATRTLSGAPPAGKLFGIGGGYSTSDVRSYAMPCRPGDKVEGSTYFSCSGVDQVYAEVRFWDKAGIPLQPPYALGAVQTDFSAQASAVGPTSLTRAGGFKIAPAATAYASFETIARTSGAAAPNLTITLPVLRIAQAGAAELAPFSEGVPDPSADVTGEKTSARVLGQGDLATAPLTAAQVTNANVALGANLVTDSGLVQGLSFFGPGFSNLPPSLISRHYVAGTFGNFVHGYLTGGTSGNVAGVFDLFLSDPYNAASLTDLQRFACPLAGGERLYASVHAQFGNGATGVGAHVWFWGVLGDLVGESDAAIGGRTGDNYVGFNGDIDGHFDRVGGFVTAPAGARFATVGARVYYTANLNGNDAHAGAARPFLAKVGADQAAPPPYVAGPTDRGANATGENTALSIVGQSPIAAGNSLTTGQVTNALVATGSNRVVNSTSAKGMYGFAPTPSIQSSQSISNFGSAKGLVGARGLDLNGSYSGVRHVPWANLSGVFSVDDFADAWWTRSGWGGGSFDDTRQFGLPVQTGQTVYGRVLGAQHRCRLTLFLLFFDGSGTFLTGPGFSGALDNGGQAGAPSAFNEVGGVVTAPTGAAYMALLVRMYGLGASDPFVFFAEPAMGVLPSGQTALPPYSGGPPDPLGDQTSDNTAQSFLGKGALATANSVNLATQASGALPAGQVLYASGGTVDSLRPAQAGADVTSTHTAQSVMGQSVWATTTAISSPSVIAGRTSQLQDDGYIQAGTVYKPGSTFLTNLWPQEAGANVTETRTALSFNGKTAWATFNRSTGVVTYLDDSGRIVSGNGLPFGIQTGVGATFSPQFPLHSDSPGLLQVSACTIYLAGGVQVNTPSSSFSTGAGQAYDVFYNVTTGTFDFVPDGTNQKATPDVYVFLGRLAVRNGDNTVPPPPAVPTGYGGGYGGGDYSTGRNNVGLQQQ